MSVSWCSDVLTFISYCGFLHVLIYFKPIENTKDREKLWNYILEFQRKGMNKFKTKKWCACGLSKNRFFLILVQPLKKLDWFNEPAPYGLVGKVFPAFSVTSTSFLTDSLQLISHGLFEKKKTFLFPYTAS